MVDEVIMEKCWRSEVPAETLSEHHFVNRKIRVHWHEIAILQRHGSGNKYPCYYLELWHHISHFHASKDTSLHALQKPPLVAY